jgi:C-terminal processing protease CtpA/Prc
VFPERSRRAVDLLRDRLAAGAYPPTPGPQLCQRLSADLFDATEDKHLRLIWHESAETSRDESDLVNELRELFRRENQGVRRVERLAGNVGVVELTLVPEVALAAPTLTAAMCLVQHTHALIIDLRAARGGSPDAVCYFASFFFPDGDTRLSDVIDGPDGAARQFWTYAYLPAPRYLDRPVYLLTSATTFSGGESLAYDLQALGRGTVVGETTRGGAHPSEVVSIAPHVELRLPVARPVNPITGGNWETVGVQPDVLASSAEAFGVAYQAALETIAGDEELPDVNRREAASALRGQARATPTESRSDEGGEAASSSATR